MRIGLRDENRQRLGWIEVDPAQRPTRVVAEDSRLSALGHWLSALSLWRSSASTEIAPPKAESGKPTAHREVFLNWDTALDDAGQLRRCVSCGCTDMFREKAFPQVTAVVVVLAFMGAIIGVFGMATELPVLIIMAVVLVLDVAILFFSRRRLVCYRCRSTYHDLPIAPYHRAWDRALADRHPALGVSATSTLQPRREVASSSKQLGAAKVIVPPSKPVASQTSTKNKGFFA